MIALTVPGGDVHSHHLCYAHAMTKIRSLTHAITHIRLHNANRSKLAALNAVVDVYLPLCQQYTTYFCTQAAPDKFADPVFPSALSQRWQRVAIQQAAGIAQVLAQQP